MDATDLWQGRECFVIIPSQEEDALGRVGYYCTRSWETTEGPMSTSDFVAGDEVALMRWVMQAIVGIGTLAGSADGERNLLEAVFCSLPQTNEEVS